MLPQVISDFRDQRQRGAHGTMAAGLAPLSDDGSCTCFQCLIDVPEALHLADQLGAAAANLLSEGPWIAEGEEHAMGGMTERDFQHVRRACQRPCNEPDTELLTLDMGQLLTKVGFTAENAGKPSSDDTETPGAGDGGGQATASYESHRGTYDWMRNSERLSQPGLHGSPR